MTDPTLSRRGFLKASAAAAGGLVIGWQMPAQAGSPADMAFNPFVKIGTDNRVTVISKHLDKGQGVTTGLATIVAEELDADWSQMQTDFAPANVTLYANSAFGVQGTGGSTAMANSWMQYRQAGAAARRMLVQAAAKKWGVEPSAIEVRRGELLAGDKRASFGALALAAAKESPPQDPALKDLKDFTLIGTAVPRLDSAAKTEGQPLFTLDIDRPGQLVALMAHPPRFGATLKAFDAAEAEAVEGVQAVYRTPRGVAVLANGFWAAKTGRDALKLEWDFRQAENRSTAQMAEDYRALAERSGAVARSDGDVAGALSRGRTVSARFDFPFLAHATMEPMDCVVEMGTGRCDIWTGSQLQTVDQQVVAALTGLSPDNVHIHTRFAGGSFGRRAVPDSDYIAEAVMVAKAHQEAGHDPVPIKLQWTREDDMRAGRYRPMSHHVLTGALDKAGRPIGWHHRIVTQSFLGGTPFEGLIQDGVDGTAVEGARGLPYAIANLKVEWVEARSGVPALWWRSVGHSHNAYATEVFFDRLARQGGQDPIALRRDMLAGQPRHRAVYDLLLAKLGPAPSGDGRGRGVALHESFGSVAAQAADVRLDGDGLRVERVVCAVDCGIAINPDIVVAQMEGGIGYGLSAAMREEITLTDGEVDQANFDSYRPLRIQEMPQVEVHILPSANPPSGVGEPGLPPLAPAVANALQAIDGRVMARLPFGDLRA